MEKTINDLSIGFFLWQTFIFVLLLFVIYYLYKLYGKVDKHFDKKT